MVNLIKKIWAGPFIVKSSLLFLAFMALIYLVVMPGPVIVWFTIMLAVYNIVEWLSNQND